MKRSVKMKFCEILIRGKKTDSFDFNIFNYLGDYLLSFSWFENQDKSYEVLKEGMWNRLFFYLIFNHNLSLFLSSSYFKCEEILRFERYWGKVIVK